MEQLAVSRDRVHVQITVVHVREEAGDHHVRMTGDVHAHLMFGVDGDDSNGVVSRADRDKIRLRRPIAADNVVVAVLVDLVDFERRDLSLAVAVEHVAGRAVDQRSIVERDQIVPAAAAELHIVDLLAVLELFAMQRGAREQ